MIKPGMKLRLLTELDYGGVTGDVVFVNEVIGAPCFTFVNLTTGAVGWYAFNETQFAIVYTPPDPIKRNLPKWF